MNLVGKTTLNELSSTNQTLITELHPKTMTSQAQKIYRATGGILKKAFPLGSTRRYVAYYGPCTVLFSVAALAIMYIAFKALKLAIWGAGSAGHYIKQNFEKHNDHADTTPGDVFLGSTAMVVLGIVGFIGFGIIVSCIGFSSEKIREHFAGWKKKQKELIELQKMEAGIITSKLS